MSKLEERDGWLWAKEVILSVKQTTRGWKATLLKTLEWGLVEKPEDYKVGVMRGINVVKACPDQPFAIETDNDQ